MELLAAIDPSPDVPIQPTWSEVSQSTEAAKAVVKGLVEFIHNFGNRKLHEVLCIIIKKTCRMSDLNFYFIG